MVVYWVTEGTSYTELLKPRIFPIFGMIWPVVKAADTEPPKLGGVVFLQP